MLSAQDKALSMSPQVLYQLYTPTISVLTDKEGFNLGRHCSEHAVGV